MAWANGSRDDKYNLTAQVEVWEPKSGTVIRTIPIQGEVCECLAFSPDGRRLAGAGSAKVQVWDVASGQELRTFARHARPVGDLAFSPDGARIVSGSSDTGGQGEVRVWEVETGRENFDGVYRHPKPITAVAFHPSGRQFVAASRDGSIKLYDAKSGADVLSFPGHAEAVTGLAFSPDGDRLFSAGKDRTIRTWEVATGQEVMAFRDVGECQALVLSVNGHRLAADTRSGVHVWNATPGRELVRFEDPGAGRTVAFSPDGRHVALGGYDAAVRVREVNSGRKLQSLSKHTETVRGVAYSGDGRLASGGGGRPSRPLGRGDRAPVTHLR